MKSTLRIVDDATGMEKFSVLAAAVERVIEDQDALRQNLRVDDELETLELITLAQQYNVTQDTLRKQIEKELGTTAAMKVGKKWVVRKRTYLEFLRRLESKPLEDIAR